MKGLFDEFHVMIDILWVAFTTLNPVKVTHTESSFSIPHVKSEFKPVLTSLNFRSESSAALRAGGLLINVLQTAWRKWPRGCKPSLGREGCMKDQKQKDWMDGLQRCGNGLKDVDDYASLVER